MKLLLRALLIILIMLSSISFTYSAAKTFGDTNIRDVPCIGFRIAGTNYDLEEGWMQKKYDEDGFKEMYEANPQAFEKANLCMMRNIKWKHYYVNPNLAPTSRAQAQDPNWENYKWNTDDTVGDMLNHELVSSGKLKILIGFATTATEQSKAPPAWFLANDDYWYGTSNQYGRWDNQEVVDHIADFQIAFVKKYGNHKGLAGIQFGEYYRGQDSLSVPGFNTNAYFQGKRDLWRQVSEALPLDSDGTRVALYQVNPLMKGGVTKEDLIRYGVGASRSDSPLFKEGCGENGDRACNEGSVYRLIQDLEGKVPNKLMGDAKWSVQGIRLTWNGYPNPFGHGQGFSSVASPQQLMWYYSSKGIAPINSIFMNIDNGEDPYNLENYIDAVSKFGPEGSLADEWGMIPAHFDPDSVQYDSYWENPNEQSSDKCYKIDSGDLVPEGFAAPYDLETLDVFFKGQCTSNSININVGSRGITYVYEKGYYWDGNDWRSITYNGQNAGSSSWLTSNGVRSLNTNGLPDDVYILSYACKWTGSEWKCGCQDSSCNSPAWNVQRYSIN